MRWSPAPFVFLLAGALSAQPGVEQDWASDEVTLKGMGLPSRGDALLQIFRDRTPQKDTVEQFHQHVARLGAAPFAERIKATGDLVKMGPVVRPLLDHLIADAKLDLETKRRLQHVLEHFPADRDIAATSAAARLLQRDKPADRLKVLFEFVPHAANESVRQEIQHAINDVALLEKKPAPLLLETLNDTNVARRAAAAEALVRAVGPVAAKERIAPLLKDAHPRVRYQLGMALVETHDRAGLPLLIQSIVDETPERVEFVMDLLYRAAGETAPAEFYHGKKNAEKVAAGWRKWHEKHQASLDLSKLLARTDHGYTLITTMALKANMASKVMELGAKPQNAIRWQFDAPRYPVDVQILGPNRLLMAEYIDRRVTERDFKGNILRQFPATNPVGCQRLPNEQTFIVTRQQLQIVDADGKQVFSWFSQPNPNIMAAHRLKNGQMAVITSGGNCQLLDSDGKELKRCHLGVTVSMLGSNFEVLANGRLLVPLYAQNEIAEFDWTGAKLWQASVNRPLSVTRLRNGNTLVTCYVDNKVVELDREGREVWSYHTDGRPFRARRR